MADQTPPELPELEDNPSTLDLAKRALATAEGVAVQAQRDPLGAAINNAAGYQRAYLEAATAHAAVASAEALERVAVALERLVNAGADR